MIIKKPHREAKPFKKQIIFAKKNCMQKHVENREWNFKKSGQNDNVGLLKYNRIYRNRLEVINVTFEWVS